MDATSLVAGALIYTDIDSYFLTDVDRLLGAKLLKFGSKVTYSSVSFTIQ